MDLATTLLKGHKNEVDKLNALKIGPAGITSASVGSRRSYLIYMALPPSFSKNWLLSSRLSACHFIAFIDPLPPNLQKAHLEMLLKNSTIITSKKDFCKQKQNIMIFLSRVIPSNCLQTFLRSRSLNAGTLNLTYRFCRHIGSSLERGSP